jgi:hypothetical protein
MMDPSFIYWTTALVFMLEALRFMVSANWDDDDEDDEEEWWEQSWR